MCIRYVVSLFNNYSKSYEFVLQFILLHFLFLTVLRHNHRQHHSIFKWSSHRVFSIRNTVWKWLITACYPTLWCHRRRWWNAGTWCLDIKIHTLTLLWSLLYSFILSLTLIVSFRKFSQIFLILSFGGYKSIFIWFLRSACKATRIWFHLFFNQLI